MAVDGVSVVMLKLEKHTVITQVGVIIEGLILGEQDVGNTVDASVELLRLEIHKLGNMVLGAHEEQLSPVGQVVGVIVVGEQDDKQLPRTVKVLVEVLMKVFVLKMVSGGRMNGGNVVMVVLVVVEMLPDNVDGVHD